MKHPRRQILQRSRVFVSIEGKDGYAFMTWLQKRLDEHNVPVHLDRHSADGGGYQSMLNVAIKKRKHGLKKENYNGGSFLFVDTDRADSGNDYSLARLQQQAGNTIKIIPMKPNFEGVLLTLLSGETSTRSDVKSVKQKLLALWPDYEKPIQDAYVFTQKLGTQAMENLNKTGAEWQPFLDAILFKIVRREPP